MELHITEPVPLAPHGTTVSKGTGTREVLNACSLNMVLAQVQAFPPPPAGSGVYPGKA